MANYPPTTGKGNTKTEFYNSLETISMIKLDKPCGVYMAIRGIDKQLDVSVETMMKQIQTISLSKTGIFQKPVYKFTDF